MFDTMLSMSLPALISTVLLLSAPGLQHPAAVTPEGASAAVPLAAQARRVHLLGAVEIYSVALYVDVPLSERARLIATDVPKALRIEIAYEEETRPRVTFDWRRELVPSLETPAATTLRGAFAGLKRGDTISVEFAPGEGTTVRANKRVVASEASHDLMLAFLDHWLGQRPVSEDMKQALLQSAAK
jgi:hypothetical protein